MKWEGVIRTLSKEDFARAFQRWLERCEKKSALESAVDTLRKVRKYIF
jgi:hypothetical protein